MDQGRANLARSDERGTARGLDPAALCGSDRAPSDSVGHPQETLARGLGSGVSEGGPSDERLMELFRDGDGSAYEVLVHRHLDFVHRHARRFLGDSSGADDIAQEVFLRLHRSADRFREPTNFLGWLATMTSRLALNELRTRTRKRWTARSALDGEDPGRDWRPGAENGVEGVELSIEEERAELVRRAISELPERQQAAIWLQRFEGWSLDEIGDAMGLTIPAIKSLLHRARVALSLSLRPYFDEDEAGTIDDEPPTKGRA